VITLKKFIIAVSIIAFAAVLVTSTTSTGVTTNLRDPGGGGA
jgi:hypothetical protein